MKPRGIIALPLLVITLVLAVSITVHLAYQNQQTKNQPAPRQPSSPTPSTSFCTPSNIGDDVLKKLCEYVIKGKLEQGVFTLIKNTGKAEAILAFDASAIRARFEEEKARRGIPSDDQQILAEKAKAYSNLKKQVQAAVPELVVLQDYNQFPIQFVLFPNKQVLLDVLQQPQVISVNENKERYPL